MIIKSKKDLEIIKNNYADRVRRRSSNKGKSERIDILVGMATCGIAAGAQEVFDTLSKEVASLNNPDIKVIPVGCMGYCHSEPTVVVCLRKKEPTIYGKVNATIAHQIIEDHIMANKVVKSHVMDMEFDRTLSGGQP